tara:strand:+ start:1478 stop:1894 length:417 start_codon:yes stop_codon:yes gene_type:complete
MGWGHGEFWDDFSASAKEQANEWWEEAKKQGTKAARDIAKQKINELASSSAAFARRQFSSGGSSSTPYQGSGGKIQSAVERLQAQYQQPQAFTAAPQTPQFNPNLFLRQPAPKTNIVPFVVAGGVVVLLGGVYLLTRK